ncbi:MAG TPA: laminin B domain-containing protein [Parafilimonas sp.]|nr:laminin B domain-containing protein [Parafilimonas sp.]
MKKLLALYILSVIVLAACTKEVITPSNAVSANDENADNAVLEDTVLYKHSFNKNTQGWKIQGDAQGSSVEPTYESTGGNPGGYIAATDDVTGGVWYFSAPANFLDNLKNKYGKVLKFNLKQSSTSSQFDADDIILEGGGMILHYDTDNNPGITWTKYRVSLRSSNWLKEDDTAPTAKEMKAVLKNITRLWIRGEYRSGADIGGLDNVAIAEKID